MTALKRRGIKEFCLNASLIKQKPGEFWKKLKPLLPNNKPNTDSKLYLIEEGKIITKPASIFTTRVFYYTHG